MQVRAPYGSCSPGTHYHSALSMKLYFLFFICCLNYLWKKYTFASGFPDISWEIILSWSLFYPHFYNPLLAWWSLPSVLHKIIHSFNLLPLTCLVFSLFFQSSPIFKLSFSNPRSGEFSAFQKEAARAKMSMEQTRVCRPWCVPCCRTWGMVDGRIHSLPYGLQLSRSWQIKRALLHRTGCWYRMDAIKHWGLRSIHQEKN